MDPLIPRGPDVHVVRPRYVVSVLWVVYRMAENAICDFGNASFHEVVKVE
jgi:hypothetical protein